MVVVIVGVLIALSADRWVQALDEEERRRTQLGWIVSDLEADSVTLADAIVREGERVQQSSYLLDSVAGLDREIPEEEFSKVVTTFSLATWSTPPNYSTATWSEMVAAGELSLIEDPELRRGLSEYYLSHTRIRESEDDREQHFQKLEEAVNRIRPISSAEFELVYGSARGVEGFDLVQSSESEVDAIRSALRTDADLRGMITYAGAAGAVRTRIYGGLMQSIAALLARARAAIH